MKSVPESIVKLIVICGAVTPMDMLMRILMMSLGIQKLYRCSMLIPVECWRCPECKKSNERLRQRFKAYCKEEAHQSTINDNLTTKQRMMKLKQPNKEIKNSKRKIDYLYRVKLQLQTEGVTIDSDIG